MTALLQDRSLFFARSDKLGDEFEGLLPIRNMLTRERFDESLADQQAMRKHTLVSCWHLNRTESDALWQVYGRSGEAVAIRTTCQRFADSFQANTHPVYIGIVYYADYDFGGIAREFEPFSFLFKRNSFEHEREVRAVIRTSSPPSAGRNVAVDLDELVLQVYVAPTAPDWFMRMVTSLLKRYELPRPVKRSKLRPDL